LLDSGIDLIMTSNYSGASLIAILEPAQLQLQLLARRLDAFEASRRVAANIKIALIRLGAPLGLKAGDAALGVAISWMQGQVGSAVSLSICPSYAKNLDDSQPPQAALPSPQLQSSASVQSLYARLRSLLDAWREFWPIARPTVARKSAISSLDQVLRSATRLMAVSGDVLRIECVFSCGGAHSGAAPTNNATQSAAASAGPDAKAHLRD
jgi:hypothetical protein